MKLFLTLLDKSPKTLVEAAKLADEYTALRKATQYSMPPIPFQRDRGYGYNPGNYKANVVNTQKNVVNASNQNSQVMKTEPEMQKMLHGENGEKRLTSMQMLNATFVTVKVISALNVMP